jgi:aquaporin Z
MRDQDAARPPWQALLSELVGTALLVLFGLSLVILMFGAGSPVARIVPGEGARRLITGFLFGTTGALIALSPVGKESGAHINPVVTLGFWLLGKLNLPTVVGYVLAQLAGAVAGALPLLAWGPMGRSVAFGATLPGEGYSAGFVLLGEAVTTFALIAGLCVFLGFRGLRRFTPAMFPFLYAYMVWAEAPISGTSTNPARSLGPAIVSGQWRGFWIYLVGPLIGMLAAIIACSFLAKKISVAKLYYFDSDPHRVFYRTARPS